MIEVGEITVLESSDGSDHPIGSGMNSVFVFGNRYSPDLLEGRVPESDQTSVDLLAESGVVGMILDKHAAARSPTRILILGYLVNEVGDVLNTIDHALPAPSPLPVDRPRAKMILNVGVSMNSGKTRAAMACCQALAHSGEKVLAAKVTGTAGVADIEGLQSAGAIFVADFTHLGWPSTYLADKDDLISIFQRLDAQAGSDPGAFWVVEISDGLLQRETAMLLRDSYVRGRIHRLILSASDALGAVGGLSVLKDDFGLTPHALSGRMTASPLMVKEIRSRTDIPVFDSTRVDVEVLRQILV